MSEFNREVPPGTENKVRGAARIRNLKNGLEVALQNQGIFPGANLSAPIFIPTIWYGDTGARAAADTNLAGRWYYNTDTKTIQRDNGTSWSDISFEQDAISSGDKMIFCEASAPTGWTQVITGIGDRFFRCVTGTTGGTATAGDSISSPPTHNHSGDVVVSGDLTHQHAVGIGNVTTNHNLNHSGDVNVIGSFSMNDVDLTHKHGITAVVGFSPKYLDSIVCIKD